MDFSSLNLENLGDIMSSLSEDDMAKLNSLADELFRDKDKEKKSEKSSADKTSSFDLFSGLDPAVMNRLMNIITRLNSAPDDPRCNVIASLKPLLSKDKQQKADEAIKMLQLLSLIPLLGDTI